ncbi:unnamed protein product [Didymodactylos carnosus]|uniref:Uncharacterized protein n=1 Tax=Didymodactylos carnosus TaxID=1234261 RepID=A0A814PLC0_9BILA|nr:unnamed protein product [Didymodactylos carnosus]CAF3872227.1 unnamed protein product [Didymodactylos carnosus]
MNLILNVSSMNDIENILNRDYVYFEKNLNDLHIFISKHISNHVKLLGLITWIKYYTHTYAYALINDSKQKIMVDIDKLLSNNDTSFCSTIKIFIIKQMMYFNKKTFNELMFVFKDRNVTWTEQFQHLIISDQRERQIKDFLLPLPLPLFQCKKQFFHIDKILRSLRVINDFRYLITQCGNNSRLTISLYSWFIQYYSNIYTTNDNVNNFEPIGIEFITNLCKNFKTSNSTYFQLSSSMSNNDVYLRVTVLRIFTLFLSSKCTKNVTYLNCLLFDVKTRNMPNKYLKHLQSTCLFGLYRMDPIVKQMEHVKKSVQERLDGKKINEQGKFIY